MIDPSPLLGALYGGHPSGLSGGGGRFESCRGHQTPPAKTKPLTGSFTVKSFDRVYEKVRVKSASYGCPFRNRSDGQARSALVGETEATRSTAVGVAQVIDIRHVYLVVVLVDAIADPVLAAPCPPRALEGGEQRRTDVPRLVAQRALVARQFQPDANCGDARQRPCPGHPPLKATKTDDTAAAARLPAHRARYPLMSSLRMFVSDRSRDVGDRPAKRSIASSTPSDGRSR
jgi:hypothetical protein